MGFATFPLRQPGPNSLQWRVRSNHIACLKSGGGGQASKISPVNVRPDVQAVHAGTSARLHSAACQLTYLGSLLLVQMFPVDVKGLLDTCHRISSYGAVYLKYFKGLAMECKITFTVLFFIHQFFF